MKIEKKHAVNIAKMVGLSIEKGYYPLSDQEAELFARVHGFGIHHGILPEVLEGPGANHLAKLPPKTKRARLDIDGKDAWSLVDLHSELQQDVNGLNVEYMKPTDRYLRKTFDVQD